MSIRFRQLTPMALALLPMYLYADDTIDMVELPEVQVIGKAKSGNRGYTTAGSNTATGMNMHLKETPQSISVITHQQLTDQNIKTLDSAIVQATGVTQRIWGSNRAGYNDLYARGSKITNYRLNGLATNNAGLDTGNMGTAAYERVEVVRGVSSLLDGSGEPGATINVIRKRPTAEAQSSVSANLGSRQRHGIEADVSGSLNEAQSLRARAVLSYEKGDSWRKREDDQAASFYGIMEYDLSDATQWYAGLQWQYAKENGSASHTFSAYDDEGYATHFGPKDNPAPLWAFSRTQSRHFFTGIKHYFDNGVKAEVEYQYTKSKWYHPYGVAGLLGVNHQNQSALLIPGYWLGLPTSHSLNASLSGQYEIAGRNHEFIMGFNGFHYADHGNGGRGAPILVDNVYHDDNIANIPRPDFDNMNPLSRQTEQKQYGAYASTHLHPTDKWSLVLGGRYSQVDYGGYNSQIQGIAHSKNSRFTPYVGMVYQLSDTLSAYAAYSSLFIPQKEKDQTGDYLNPITGNNLELGLKGEWQEGRVNASVAVFQTEKNNLAIVAGQHPDGERYYQAVDKAKTTGFEIEIGGEIKPDWHIHAGFAQTLSRDQNQQRLNTETSPKYSFKLFTRYQLPQTWLKWTIGGGVRWQSETHSTSVLGMVKDDASKQRALSNAKQKAYSVVDLMARYQINPKASLTLNVNNTFNTEYRNQPDRRSFGSPRTINATWRYQF